MLPATKMAVIKAFAAEGRKPTHIEHELHVYRGAVCNVFSKCSPSMKFTKPDRLKVLIKRECRKATTTGLSACALLNLYASQFSIRTMHFVLQNAAHLKWRKMKSATPLTFQYQSGRKILSRDLFSPTSSGKKKPSGPMRRNLIDTHQTVFHIIGQTCAVWRILCCVSKVVGVI